MPRMKLTRQHLDALKVDRRTEYYDSMVRDLELRVEADPSMVRTWFVRYSPDGSERRVRFKLGRYPDIPITIARERAQRIIAEAHGGKDHSAQRKDDRAAHSVRELGALYVDKHAKRFKRTWRQDELMLVADVYPFIGEHKANKVVAPRSARSHRPQARCRQAVRRPEPEGAALQALQLGGRAGPSGNLSRRRREGARRARQARPRPFPRRSAQIVECAS